MVPTAAGEAGAVKILQHVDSGVSSDGGGITKGSGIKAFRSLGGEGAKGLLKGGEALRKQEAVLRNLKQASAVVPAQALLIEGFGVEVLSLSDVVNGGRLLGGFREVMGKPVPGSDIGGIQGGMVGRLAIAIAIQDELAIIQQSP